MYNLSEFARTVGAKDTKPRKRRNSISGYLEQRQLDKKYIKVEGGCIKRIGKYNATIRLHRSVVVDIPVIRTVVLNTTEDGICLIFLC